MSSISSDNERRLERRAILRAASIGLVGYLSPASAQEAIGSPIEGTGLIVRQAEPQNLESPPSAFRTLLTPTEQFYVRNHFARPQLSSFSWRLKIEGAVAKPTELTYEDLIGMPSRTMPAMLECAGNGRATLVPKVPGTQWQMGGMGNAEWTGVPLSSVLERIGVKASAQEVLFEGADEGELKDEPKTPGRIHFARSLPLTKARNGDVLLAYKMNGKDLPPAHGFPVRAVVPGWYGMASVKWLTRMVVTEKPFDGFFQSLQYSYWERPNGVPSLRPLTEIQVKTAIISPALNEVIPDRSAFPVKGLAWAGEADIAGVEVSTDGGKSWGKARLTGSPVRYSWRAWEFPWKPNSPGEYSLMARGTDSRGRVQPMERDQDRRNYEISHVLPVRVLVR